MTRKMSPPVISKPDWGLVQMPWGKHKGSLVRTFRPRTCGGQCERGNRIRRGGEELLDAIKNFLNQANA